MRVTFRDRGCTVEERTVEPGLALRGGTIAWNPATTTLTVRLNAARDEARAAEMPWLVRELRVTAVAQP